MTLHMPPFSETVVVVDYLKHDAQSSSHTD